VSRRDATDLRRTSIRLAVQFGAVSVVLLAALIGITFAIVGASLAESVDGVLVDASLVPGIADAPHDVLLAFSVDGKVSVSGNAPGWFPDKALFAAAAKSDDPITTTETEHGHTYTIRTDSDPGRLVQAAVDTAESSEELRRLGLRTPLTVLSTRAQLLRRELAEGRNPESVAGEVDDILQDSRELTEILEDLLIAADPRETMATAPVDLADLAREAVAAFAVQASNAGIALGLEGDSIAVPVNGSRSSLLRLFTSLISNAIDHADTLVVVTVRSKGRNAEIAVRDDGPGFPDSMLGHAFERFATSRSTTSASSHPRHYGLGLALVADVATRHHGSVAVDPSRPGTGAVIRVAIPLRKS
jgi:two-component system OmpR family sensor kinase